MNRILKKAALLLCSALSLTACVTVDNELGKELLDKSLLYHTYTVEFDLEDIQLKHSDELSGYSDSRIAVGAIRDELFGLTTRSSAFTLVPTLDTLDLGKDPVPVKFALHFAADSISCADPAEEHILQNIYVYALTDTLSLDDTRASRDIPHGTERITRGVPVYAGTDSLSFEFTDEFARRYIQAIQEVGGASHVLVNRNKDNGFNKYSDFIRLIPGIYLESDIPEGYGGRINLIHLSCLSVSNNYYTRNGNIGTLTVNAEYDGVRKDTTFILIPGEPTFYDEAEYISNNQKFYQYAFNRTTHETENMPVTDAVYIEGGTGIKPVFSARELQEKAVSAITARGGDPAKAIINKASLILPYEMPEDYTFMDLYPTVLSPTIRLTDKESGSVSFGGLTDASASGENQGDIDRANLYYAPDITYHMQELLTRDDLDTKDDGDVWLLTVHTETVEKATGSAYDDYQRQMMYAMYYNNLYGGGYGYGGYGGYGYGGYGYGGYGYGSSYYNYYNYMMMAQMMNSSSSTVSTTQELDKDRYYRAILNAPGSARAPKFRLTFSIPQD